MAKLKLIKIAFAILLIIHQQQNCLVTGFIVTAIDTLSAVMSLGEIIFDHLSTDPDETDVLRALNNQWSSTNVNFERIVNDLKYLPALTNFVNVKEDLAGHFSAIDSIYDEAVDIKNQIAEGQFFPDSVYSIIQDEPWLQEHFNAVYIFMLNKQWSPFRMNDFITQVQMYENSCATGTSHLHLLDRIFANLRLSTIKYLTARLIIHDSLFINKDDKYLQKYKANMQNDKKNLLVYVNKKYKKAAAQLKAAMAKASNEIWSCDPLKNGKKDNTSYTQVPALTNTVLNKSPDKQQICWNVIPSVCEKVDKKINDEDRVYINNFPIKADKYHVIVGVKFEFKANILSLNIKQGKLLSNGSIDVKTISWKAENGYSKTNETELNIRHTGVRGFDLTEVKLPDNHVLTGLQFKKGHYNRVYLSIEYSKIDFRKGKFIGSPLTADAPQGTSELNLGKCENPIFASYSKMDSNNDQFVYFKDTPDFKTDRKNVIDLTYPFVDLQKIAPNTLLSGIGLFHQGQEGYGGFLSLKLYTFNITSYIVEDMEIEKPPKFLNELKIEEIRKNLTNLQEL